MALKRYKVCGLESPLSHCHFLFSSLFFFSHTDFDTLATPSPLDMPAQYPLRLDPWQLSLKYLSSATELPGDSVAQLVKAWQAICQVAGSSPSLSHCHFLSSHFFLSHWLWVGLRSDCQVWSMSKIWVCALSFVLATPPSFVPVQLPLHVTLSLLSCLELNLFAVCWCLYTVEPHLTDTPE